MPVAVAVAIGDYRSLGKPQTHKENIFGDKGRRKNDRSAWKCVAIASDRPHGHSERSIAADINMQNRYGNWDDNNFSICAAITNLLHLLVLCVRARKLHFCREWFR